MKKITICLIAISIIFFSPCHPQDLDQMQTSFDEAVGLSASDGMATGIGASMMGWGLTIAIGISILAIVLHQSAAAAPTTATTAKGGTGSGVGTLL